MRRPTTATRTETLVPYTASFRLPLMGEGVGGGGASAAMADGGKAGSTAAFSLSWTRLPLPGMTRELHFPLGGRRCRQPQEGMMKRLIVVFLATMLGLQSVAFVPAQAGDRKSTRSELPSLMRTSYAVFRLKTKH